LLSDGGETDGNAYSGIRGIASEGIKVDVVSLSALEHDEVQIIGVETPDRNIAVGEKVTLGLTLQSNVGGRGHEVNITLVDTVYGETETVQKEPVTITKPLEKGVQTVELDYTFDTDGMHELYFKIEHKNEVGDTVVQNNTYYSYLRMQVFDKILIVEKNRGESSRLEALLAGDEFEYNVTTVCAADKDQIPTTVGELCNYEQVILVNIANKDVTSEFFEALNVYVSDLGGGLFTVGGDYDTNSSGKVVPHAYNRDDMLGTLYQQMLPVRVVDYTPPVAVMIVVDNSGSMGSGDTGLVNLAKNGALACVDALTSRDYCGIMTFSDSQKEEIEITPLSRREEVIAAIRRIPEDGAGGTVFEGVIERAGSALAALDVARKHIIIVSDGVIDDRDYDRYIEIVKDNYKKGITLSVVGLRVYGAYIDLMQKTCDEGGGEFYNVASSGNIASTMFKDLMNNAILEIEYGKQFTLRIGEHTSAVAGIAQLELDKLPFTGYYGTSLKNGAVAPLIGEYVPMYAQWKYGNGNVGSFMCDLGNADTSWSKGFLESEVGKRFMKNVFTGLFPTEEISLSDIEVSFKDDNYTTQLNVYTPREETDTVSVTVTPQTATAEDFYAQTPVQVVGSDGNTRFTFVITCPGLYEIKVQKKNAQGAVLSERTLYRTFSYSQEYNTFPEEDAQTGEEFLAGLAEGGKGKVVTDSLEVFDSFEKTIKRTADPRLAFLIIAIVLFLLDIAVRKFKFKWIHELIRDRKARKELQRSNK
ncbi:MAG: VWA domain-containing protein, partial [Clostridiales bacterium]|nr:VWA domain-containing protein [Clostridiales bacterium]